MKIPVGRTIERAYGFAFSNLLNIVGIAWFPFVVFIGVIAGVAIALAPTLGPAFENNTIDPSKVGSIIGLALLFILLALVIVSMVKVGILRQALGKHHGGVFIYFSLGAPVWRLIGALLLGGIVMWLICLALFATGAILWGIAANIPSPGGIIAARTALVIVGGCLAIYIGVRLLFLLPAVVVGEDTIGLGRSWTLSGGNFWRIFVIWLACYLPLAIAFGIISALVTGGATMPNMHAGMTPQEAIQAYVVASRSGGIAGAVLNLIYLIASAGLSAGAVANAYLAACGDKDMENA